MKEPRSVGMSTRQFGSLVTITAGLTFSFLTYPAKAQVVQVPPNCNPYINNAKREQIIRNYQGNPKWTRICNPAVNVPFKVYPIRFQYGDKVRIRGGGCVQRGGDGRTWKRYVNPSGFNSQRYHHGQIRIPLITGGLKNFSSQGGSDTWIEMGTVEYSKAENYDPFSHNFLILGYTDTEGDYGDNGYWGHDDGTEDQCRGIYGAYVDIWIERK